MQKFLLLSFIGFAGTIQAQVVGTDAFIKGNYVQIGIDGSGGFEGVDCISSTTPTIPAGYYFRSNTQYFGFVANAQKDGWINYDGDFFTPGSPENGWGIEAIDGFGTSTQAHNNCNGSNDIVGSIQSYTYAAGLTTLVWKGTYSSTYNLDFIVTYTLHDTALFFYTDVKIINNDVVPVNQLYYYRNFDPDNNVTISGDYSTNNKILAQPTATSNTASVIAYQTSPWYAGVSLTGVDSNFRAFSGGFSNRDGSDMWNGIGYTSATGTSGYADVAMGLAYNCGNVAPGDTVSFKFKIAFAKDFPLANFTTGTAGVCAGQCIDFTNTSVFATSYSWTFTGGDISSSTAVSPTVCYTVAGTYDVSLVATGPGGFDSTFTSIVVNLGAPIADFTVSSDTVYLPGAFVNFTNTSANYTSNIWYFGDVSSSGAVDVGHTYVSPGTYMVRLVAANSSCPNDTAAKPIVVIDLSKINEYENNNSITVYPNPVSQTLLFTLKETNLVSSVSLFNAFGQLVLITKECKNGINVSSLSSGSYSVVVNCGNEIFRTRIVKL